MRELPSIDNPTFIEESLALKLKVYELMESAFMIWQTKFMLKADSAYEELLDEIEWRNDAY